MDVADSVAATEVAPVVKMCNLVIYDALKSSASDVHIEPALHDLQVRMRVDGVLRDYTRVPKWLHGPVVSRLKILAKLDIAERRLPQDGRVNVHYQGRSVDLRVSTLPTHFGEKMVLRVLGGATAPAIDSLGLPPSQQRLLEAAIQQPQGMILVTGPTGSGKTTTLYALLAWHHKPEVNIVTVEDPIEFQLAGINQVQVNPKAGLTFASALRSILRQDPDVILVGEMRDRETVEIACQAAMTGHMVLSTLHTNSAVGAVTRMLDLGVDPAVLATSLSMVIAQRLVRRICTECREEYEPGEAVRNRAGMIGDRSPVYRGRGCPACGGTGFSGRIGIYEFFRPTNAIRKLINDRASEADMRMAARQAGMVPLREDAIAKIKAGHHVARRGVACRPGGRERDTVPGVQGAHRGRLRHVPVLPQEPEDELQELRAGAPPRMGAVPLLQHAIRGRISDRNTAAGESGGSRFDAAAHDDRRAAFAGRGSPGWPVRSARTTSRSSGSSIGRRSRRGARSRTGAGTSDGSRSRHRADVTGRARCRLRVEWPGGVPGPRT